MPLFSAFRLLLLLFMIILLATGSVTYEDIACLLLASLYTYFLHKFAFPPVTTDRPPRVFHGNLLQRYVLVAATVGLYLPLAYIVGAFFLHGDRHLAVAAVPHTFQLVCQVLMEQISAISGGVSLPVRAFVPVFYNTRRLFSISDWARTYFGEGILPGPWLLAGRILALANAVLWTYNLFGFLLPVYLPRALRLYYEAERAKKASASH